MLIFCLVWLQLVTYSALDILNGGVVYQSFLLKNYTMNPTLKTTQQMIVMYHNTFRSYVRPEAANMLKMSWYPNAASQAQRHAEKCKYLAHNIMQENMDPNLGVCGQNLFASSRFTPWYNVLNAWFSENTNFIYGSPNNNLTAVASYIRMVWATSHKVGCGLARCAGGPDKFFYNYVCHYCPGADMRFPEYPYKKGKYCEDCPSNCTHNLCTNACMYRDLDMNCDALVNNVEGICSDGRCNATCYCPDSIFKNYPWI